MAVYTALTQEEIQAGLACFGLGRLVRIEAVATGIENTTYFATFEQERGRRIEYVLTLGESIGIRDMEFVAALTTALASHDLPVPAPVAAKEGAHVVQLAGKPVLLIPRAEGSPPLSPSASQCRAIGHALARLHGVTASLPMTHTSHKSLAWVTETGRALLPHIQDDSRQLLATSLIRLDAFVSAHENLPQAVIHGDLFRDNTLFVGERLNAIIDFFSAGSGYLLFDLAVTANDWCTAEDCSVIPEKRDALLSGYCDVRPLTPLEQRCWGEMLGIAALRFWVSRLADRIFPTPGRPGHPTKDPARYRQLLILHSEQPQTLHSGPK